LDTPDDYRGDVNSDQNIDIADAVYLISYIFYVGNAPESLSIADVNCDTIVNLVDIIYRINYVFRGGNDPCDIDGDGIPDC
jgi:hypothetical protein